MSSTTASPVPALTPPPGATSNFAQPDDSLAKAGLICYTLYLVCATLAFWLRCYVQLRIQRKWFLEDYCLSVAYACLVIFIVLAYIMVSKGGGLHGWDLTHEQVQNVVYWYSYSSVIYSIVACGAKLCLLLLYYRLFSSRRPNKFGIVLGKPDSWLQVLILVIMFCVVGFYIPCVFIKAFQCSPQEKMWNKDIQGTCINLSILLNSSGFINTVTDLIILIIPIRGVWTLQRSTKTKLQILPIFLLGAMAPAIAVKGVITRFQVAGSQDISYTLPDISVWAGAEIAIGIVCASLPTFGALRPSFRRRNSHSHSSQQSHGYRRGTGYGGSRYARTGDDEESGRRSFSRWGQGIEITNGIEITEERLKSARSMDNGTRKLKADVYGVSSTETACTDSDSGKETPPARGPQSSWIHM